MRAVAGAPVRSQAMRSQALPIIGVACWVIVVAGLMQLSANLAQGLAVAHLVAFGGLAIVWLAANRTEEHAIARIIAVGWMLKMAGTVARYFVLEVVYGGSGDASRYTFVGGILSEQIRQGHFERYAYNKQLLGTQFVELFTGTVFAFTGVTKLGGFFVFSAIGFIGLYLIFRAVRIAVPQVDPRRYALLLFLLPSTLFWPSSIGKESLMMLCIGLVLYGMARMFEHLGGGLPLVLAGLAASALVRPHITLLMGVALMAATSLVRSRSPGEIPVAKLVRVIIFAVVLVAALSVASSFLKVDNLDAQNVGGVLEQTSERTSQGGSNFGGGGPALYPVSVITVMFRPFPFEATNVQSVIASAEATLLLYLFWKGRAGVVWGFKQVRNNGILAFVLVYSLLFFYVYSSFGNFGLLARQRVQLYPLVIMFLCMVPPSDTPTEVLGTWRQRRRTRAALDELERYEHGDDPLEIERTP